MAFKFKFSLLLLFIDALNFNISVWQFNINTLQINYEYLKHLHIELSSECYHTQNFDSFLFYSRCSYHFMNLFVRFVQNLRRSCPTNRVCSFGGEPVRLPGCSSLLGSHLIPSPNTNFDFCSYEKAGWPA